MQNINVLNNVGKAKYVVIYWDGKKKHKDNSNFEDIRIFKNKKDLNAFLEVIKCQDMADVCELAHKRTVKECKKRGIKVEYLHIDGDTMVYYPKAQIIFNKHYDNIIEITNI
jgi:hypothetical protein